MLSAQMSNIEIHHEGIERGPTGKVRTKKDIFSSVLALTTWQERELLRGIPVYDFDLFLKKSKEMPISLIGQGYFSLVFRVQHNSPVLQYPDITLKLLRHNVPTSARDIGKLLH